MTAQEVPTSGRAAQRRVLAGLFAAGVAAFALLYAPQPLLPELSSTFDVSTTGATWALSLSTAGIVVAVLPMAVLSERVGRRRVMVTSLVVASVLGVLAAFAPTWPVLLVLRALAGLALAGVPATAAAYAAEIAGPARAGVMAGLYIAGTTVGGMSGRLVSGAASDLGGWAAGLGAVAAVAVACTVAAWWLLDPDAPHPGERQKTTQAVAALWRSLDPLQLKLCTLAFLLMVAFVATYNALTFRLAAPPYELSPTLIGLVFVAYLAGAFASARAGRLADRGSRRTIVLAGAVVLVVGAVATLAAPLPAVVLGVVVLTMGFYAAHGVASGWASAAAPGERGTAAARYTIAYYGGSTAGGPAAGLAWDAGGWALVVALAVVVTAAALVVAAGLPPGRTRG